jgi:hypothetical protein
VAAGLPPESFWDQTPRTHAAIMKGRAKAFDAEAERDISLAWWIENLGRAGKSFRALSYYLAKLRPRPAQTADDVVAIFEGFAAQGLATIRKRKRD